MKKGNELNRNIDLGQFKDREGITVGRLNFGLWLIKHRRLFTVVFLVLLVILSVIFYSYAAYHYADYFFFSGKAERQAIDQLSQDSVLADLQSQKVVAKELQPGNVQVFNRSGRYDFLVKIVNPNTDFTASFNYCFLSGSETLGCASGFILPSESKYFPWLGQELKINPGVATLELRDLTWQRINAHQYPDWPAFAAERLRFAVASSTFKSAQESGLSEKIDLNTVQFSISNQSAYSYFAVPLTVVALSGIMPVGVNSYTVNNFLSGETRLVKMTWASSLPTVNKVEVYPSLNILSGDVYLKYQ